MNVKPEQLDHHLQQAGQALSPIYVLSGDEPLLVQEATDKLRKAATAAGFSERTRFHADNSFQWEQLRDEANSLSLFAERKIIELHIPNGKPGAKGTEALIDYCEQISADNLLLIITPRLDKSTQNTKWFKAVDKAGTSITFWPIDIDQLPRWIGSRLNAAGIQSTPEATQLLAEKVEGNLLAAMQEIEKLLLLLPEGQRLDEESIVELVSDSARYDLFSLIDSALAGDAERCLKILKGLEAEGTEPTLVLWSLSRELRTLLTLKQSNNGSPITEQQFKSNRVWGKKKRYISSAYQRHDKDNLQKLLQFCNSTDQAIKGIYNQSPWLILTTSLLTLANQQTSPALQVLP